MARKDKTVFKGRIRNLIYYNWKNKQCIRTIPATVRQTDATKRLAALFGKAVTISKLIRASLADVLPDHKERNMRLRFNNAIYQWLRFYQPGESTSPLHFINRFSFTEKPLPANLLKKVAVNWKEGKVEVRISPLDLPVDLPAPKGTKAVELGFVLVGCNVEKLKPVALKSKIVEHNYQTSRNETSFNFYLSSQTQTLFLLLVSARFKFLLANQAFDLNDINWQIWDVGGSFFYHRK